jgi:hypothetical protein
MQREEREDSRLFVVDAGLDAAALRAAYPDPARYAIVRGQLRPALVGSGHAAELSGYISELSIGEINVPHAFREVFEPALRDLARGQRNGMAYEVTVAFGKRLEPWITAVSRNAGSK